MSDNLKSLTSLNCFQSQNKKWNPKIAHVEYVKPMFPKREVTPALQFAADFDSLVNISEGSTPFDLT